MYTNHLSPDGRASGLRAVLGIEIEYPVSVPQAAPLVAEGREQLLRLGRCSRPGNPEPPRPGEPECRNPRRVRSARSRRPSVLSGDLPPAKIVANAPGNAPGIR